MNVLFSVDPQGPAVLQGLWDHVRVILQSALSSPYLPGLCAFLTHVLLSAPFLVLDLLGSVSPRVRSWRITARSGPPPSLRKWLKCLWRVSLSYATVVLPVTALLQALRNPEVPELAPSLWRVCAEVVGCFLLFDSFFFAWHYYMHRVPWLYRHVHQKHHRHHITFALAAQDASSAELLSQLLLAMSSGWLLGCHPLSEIIFHMLNSWLAMEVHCGYNLPLALQRFLPFIVGGAPHHDSHHRQQKGNFAPYFTHWDRLCGTYREPLL